MEQYIPKDAVIAEIEKKINEINLNSIEDWRYRLQRERDIEVMKNILSLIDTLEVKEVDLEKEAERFVQTKEFAECKGSPVMVLAKHFFELGMSVSNQLTWEDIKNLESLCIQKRVKDGLFDKEDYEEVLKRFKVQKGE